METHETKLAGFQVMLMVLCLNFEGLKGLYESFVLGALKQVVLREAVSFARTLPSHKGPG